MGIVRPFINNSHRFSRTTTMKNYLIFSIRTKAHISISCYKFLIKSH